MRTAQIGPDLRLTFFTIKRYQLVYCNKCVLFFILKDFFFFAVQTGRCENLIYLLLQGEMEINSNPVGNEVELFLRIPLNKISDFFQP